MCPHSGRPGSRDGHLGGEAARMPCGASPSRRRWRIALYAAPTGGRMPGKVVGADRAVRRSSSDSAAHFRDGLGERIC